MIKQIKNAKIISEGKITEGLDVLIENGKILDVIPSCDSEHEIIDLKGAYLAPGFIDIHCHGGDGLEFVNATEEAITKACDMHSSHGTRVLFPTISAYNYEMTYNALEAIEKLKDSCSLEIAGVHLEGPYLAPEMCGAQDTQYITAPVKEDYLKLINRFGKLISRWTYAPERDENFEFTKTLKENGIIPSCGHSSAEYGDLLPAFENGCNLITHLYSCTSTITRHGGFRHLGIIETAYLLDDMYVEAIGDGRHLPAELLSMIIKIKGTDRVCLITDAISFAGMEKIENVKGGTDSVPYIIEDGVAKLADRSAFAGSIATTDVILRRTVEAGVSLEDTVKMLTQTPAEVMKLTSKGKIKKGFDAQFTVLSDELQVMNIDF